MLRYGQAMSQKGPNGRQTAMNRTANRRADRIRYALLCACVVVLTAWVTMTVVSVLAGEMALAIVR
jgi:hypothetical protein